MHLQHGEQGFICVNQSLYATICVQPQLRTCFNQAGFILRRGEYGDIEDLACAGKQSAWRMRHGGLRSLSLSWDGKAKIHSDYNSAAAGSGANGVASGLDDGWSEI